MSQASYSQLHSSAVARFHPALVTAPPLLPGESREDYQSMRDAVIGDIQPQTTIEWLWVSDLVELSWDILRYRRLRQKILETSREIAIQSMLERIDLAGIDEDSRQPAREYIRQNVVEWRSDPSSAIEIERRLLAHDIDTDTINLEVIVRSRELYLLFDTLLNSAQNRRIALLREIESRRFGRRRIA